MKLRLDKALVELFDVPSRARAQRLIRDGHIEVEGNVVRDLDHAVTNTTRIRMIGEDHPWVSRGGVKLVSALDHFHVDPTGKVALDIGASTGGFTDVLLSRGARSVYAVDVGHDQLAARLKQDERVVNMEGVHILSLTPDSLREAPEIVVIDVSFISLTKVLGQAQLLRKEGADIIALIKPQFEVGRDAVRKGVVRDPLLHEKAITDVVAVAHTLGFSTSDPLRSPIKGGDGNTEFLIHFR